MRVFVTVGSTQFDGLVEVVLRKETLEALYAKGYRQLVIQAGESKLGHHPPGASSTTWSDQLDISIWKYKPSLLDDFKEADLVISHAGSGTILEVLRVPKPLIAVPNPTLLHNHQEELAVALHSLGYLGTARVINLPEVIRQFDAQALKPFPVPDTSKFQAILDEEMGYSL